MLRVVFFLMTITFLFAERGIVVSMNDAYAERYFIGSLHHLREELKCTLPIEIWHDGDELSERVIEKLTQFSSVTVCDFQKVFQGFYGSLRGWHSKPFMLKCTRFDEVCLMDADLYFFDDPEQMFSNEGYLKTGAYFFRDRLYCFPQQHELFSIEKFLKRREMFQSFVIEPSAYVPIAFLHLWDSEIPTIKNPVLGEFQESGCLFINRKRHENGIFMIIDLTVNREYVYDCVMGDKETFWLGFEMAQEPYTFNDFIPCIIQSGSEHNSMIHFVDGKLFYQQKEPVKISTDAFFNGSIGIFDGKDIRWKRNVTLEEIETFEKAYRSYKQYHT
jgi:hypothetical protein